MSDESIGSILRREKEIYLDTCDEDGGTAEGFRRHVLKVQDDDPLQFNKRLTEILMEASTKAWQARPRIHGPDLFSFNGIPIPTHLTTPNRGHVNADEIESDDETRFRKVSAKYATVQDYHDSATIHSRKAAEAGAAVAREWRGVDEALSRANGDMSVFLRDIADKPANGLS